MIKKIDMSQLVTKDQHEQDKKVTDNHIKKFDYLFAGVLLVLALGFITLLVAVISPIIDAWRFRTATYQTLVDKVNLINEKIDNQNNLDNHIKMLKERNPYLK